MLLDQKITVRGSKSVLGGRRWWCYQWGVITGVRGAGWQLGTAVGREQG